MDHAIIAGRTLKEWKADYPLLAEIIETKEVLWINPNYETAAEAMKNISLSQADVETAEERLSRFAPYLAHVFPETREMNGMIESPLAAIPKLHNRLRGMFHQTIPGKLYLKCDNELAIAGSIKARGGIHEVLKHAEDLAIEHHLLQKTDDYSIIASEAFRKLYSQHSIAVGSTGNLGLSIGIMSAKLGFNVTVHMSADARQWKKDLLRRKGVTVVEHNSDYSEAVKSAREQSAIDPSSYFIDDENSTNLFLGYAVAAARLKKQLESIHIPIDPDHPLFVYLPCGVGGAPGGIAFGLKLLFQDSVHCFFAEPTHSPSMLLGLMTKLHDSISVQDFGIDNKTDADGLAVGRPSGFVGKLMENLISGIYTVDDSLLYILLKTLIDLENISLEPSALAGVIGPVKLLQTPLGQQYIKQNQLEKKMIHATHIPWATGGNLVPKEIMKSYYNIGAMHLDEGGF